MNFTYTLRVHIRIGGLAVHKNVEREGCDDPNVVLEEVQNEMREKYPGEVNVVNVHIHEHDKYRLWWEVKLIEDHKRYGIP